MDREEDTLIRHSIHQWPEVTPRKIVIFYYRYLLCKNILIARYAASGRTNAWLDSQSVKALLSLLRYFGQSHQSDRIGQELERLRSEGGLPNWDELKALPKKDRFDYQMLLATLELVVAY